jgi:hypothetical protein
MEVNWIIESANAQVRIIRVYRRSDIRSVKQLLLVIVLAEEEKRYCDTKSSIQKSQPTNAKSR